jgi:hypothetical protein
MPPSISVHFNLRFALLMARVLFKYALFSSKSLCNWLLSQYLVYSSLLVHFLNNQLICITCQQNFKDGADLSLITAVLYRFKR